VGLLTINCGQHCIAHLQIARPACLLASLQLVHQDLRISDLLHGCQAAGLPHQQHVCNASLSPGHGQHFFKLRSWAMVTHLGVSPPHKIYDLKCSGVNPPPPILQEHPESHRLQVNSHSLDYLCSPSTSFFMNVFIASSTSTLPPLPVMSILMAFFKMFME